ncbi:glucose-6-phosphate dehydrogenase [Microbacterium sp. HD4P20]|uniref:glucose-6-phosphate dehydrogenase n=1 Tax=Microbacterium sp. HD4P20 TaxID=2864874 RepID=UPI001C64247C|nr:glucose-6-phosphate dehydrogenase [Microbacterium sp. HD4P20]MCP2638528.1 glucose-6-phosphate dehydrogenase [Microbacterium sp. HD4P20]
MKIVASSDWRDAIPFDTLVVVADVVPGEPTRCFTCGTDSEPQPRTELWAYKHRHPKNHDGYVRFYCAEHRPVIQRPVVAAYVASSRSARSSRAAAERRPAKPSIPERQRAVCPNCFVEVSATGECGMCSWSDS